MRGKTAKESDITPEVREYLISGLAFDIEERLGYIKELEGFIEQGGNAIACKNHIAGYEKEIRKLRKDLNKLKRCEVKRVVYVK